MDALLFMVGLALIANTIYGLVLWGRSMQRGWRRVVNIVLAVHFFMFTAAVMLGYVPWRLWKQAQLAA